MRLLSYLLFGGILTCCVAASSSRQLKETQDFSRRVGGGFGIGGLRLENVQRNLQSRIHDLLGSHAIREQKVVDVEGRVKEMEELRRSRQVNSDTVELTGAVTGDPHFVGFQSQRFDFVGRPGTTFNIISDKGLTVNARFVAGPRGKHQTFMGAVGLKFGDVQLKIQECGFKMVCGFIDGVEIKMGDAKIFPNGAKVRKKKHTVERIEVDIPSQGYKFKFASPKADIWNMPHLDIHTALTKVPEDAHGILGQTARGLTERKGEKVRKDEKYKPEGEDFDYAVSHLFSNDFKFNRHVKRRARSSRQLLGVENFAEEQEIIAVAHISATDDPFEN